MNAKDLAGKLDGMEYPVRIPRELAAAAKAAGLVIVYGASDDLMEFEGAIHDELSAYEGTTVRVDSAGLLPERSEIEDDEELKRFFERESQAREIEAVWGDDPNSPSWTYRTSIPHETFNVMEDGEIYCVGIVFSQAALTQPGQPLSKVLAVLNKHQRHIENSPGAGESEQRYALATIEDIRTDLAGLPEQPEAGRDEAVVDEADFFGCPGYRATYRGKNLFFDPDKETCEFFAEAFNAGLKASRPQAQEAAAYVVSFEGEPRVAVLRAAALEPGTKLYLHPPTNAEAVRLLRELAKDFEALAKKEELDPSRTAEEVDENWRETMLNLRAGIPAKFLAQHGGRGDEI